jgi:hypothetical protein
MTPPAGYSWVLERSNNMSTPTDNTIPDSRMILSADIVRLEAVARLRPLDRGESDYLRRLKIKYRDLESRDAEPHPSYVGKQYTITQEMLNEYDCDMESALTHSDLVTILLGRNKARKKLLRRPRES